MPTVAKLQITVDTDIRRALIGLSRLNAALRQTRDEGNRLTAGLRRLGTTGDATGRTFGRMGGGGFLRAISAFIHLGAAAGSGLASLLGLGEGAQKIAGQMGGAAAAVVLLAAAFGLIGALAPPLGALLAATLPVAFIALGAAALAADKDVKTAFGNLKNTVVGTVREAAQVMKGPLIQAISLVSARFKEMGPLFQRAFAAVAPLIDDLAQGLLDFTENALTGFNHALEASGPIMDGFESLLGSIGDGLGDFFIELTRDKDAVNGFKAALQTLGEGINYLLNELGRFFAVLAENPENIKNLAKLFQLLGVALQFVAAMANLLAPIFGYLLTTLTGALQILTGLALLLRLVISTAIDFIRQKLSEFITWLTTQWNAGWESTKQTLIAFWETIKTIVSTAVDFIVSFLAARWEALRANTQMVWAFIQTIITTVWNTIGTIIQTAVTMIQTAVQAAWMLIQTATQAAWTLIQTIIQTAWTVIQTIVVTAVAIVVNTIQTAWTTVQAVTQAVWSAIQAAIQAAWNIIQNVVQTGVNLVQNVVQAGWNVVQNITNTVWNTIKNTVTTIMNGIKTAVQSGVDAVKNIFQAGLNAAAAIVRGFVGVFTSAGRAIVEGLANGIKAGIGAVTGAVRGVMGAARKLLPFSPAKEGPFAGKGWTLYSGQSMMTALADGISGKGKAVQSALNMSLANAKSSINMATGITGGTTTRTPGGSYSTTSNNHGGDIINITVNGFVGTTDRHIQDVIVKAVAEAKRKGRS